MSLEGPGGSVTIFIIFLDKKHILTSKVTSKKIKSLLNISLPDEFGQRGSRRRSQSASQKAALPPPASPT